MNSHSETLSFPNFAGKHAHDSLVTPQDFVRFAVARYGPPATPVPEAVIFCYQGTLWRHVRDQNAVTSSGGRFGDMLCVLDATDGEVGVIGGFGIGAPVAAVLLEELVASGVRRVISIGTAGTLQPACRVGDILVADRAIRDEGVSHHYLAPATYSFPSKELTAQLKAELERSDLTYVEGTTWTIDTPYRETVAEARHYQANGVLSVEMEAAALFAVGAYRQIDVAAAFVVSDSLADLVWDPQFDREEVALGLQRLFNVAMAACRRKPTPVSPPPG